MMRRPHFSLFAVIVVLSAWVAAPAWSAPPQAVSARSIMDHISGNGSVFSGAVDLPLSGLRGIDPRRLPEGVAAVVVGFDQKLDSIGVIESSHGVVADASGILSGQANVVLILVAGVPQDVYLTVTVRDVKSGEDTLSEAAVTVGYLLGDVNGNGQVNSTDIRGVANVSGSLASVGTNFTKDLNLSSQINSTDIRIVASRSGRRLPFAAPTMTALADQATVPGVATAIQNFTVDDFDTPIADLVVTAATSDSTLLPLSGVALGGTAGSRSVTVTPAPGQVGAATITLTVSDGSQSSQESFAVDVSVDNPPKALVAADNFVGVVPLQVNFDGSRSQDSEGSIASYTWDFGDGSTGIGMEIAHTYVAAGTYTRQTYRHRQRISQQHHRPRHHRR